MNKSIRIPDSSFLLLIVFFCHWSIPGQNSTDNVTSDSRKLEAERVWELAVDAKGGRKKMYKVENLLISSISEFQLGSNKYINRDLKLYVFPNKTWSIEDYRPSVFGLTMRMYNWETGMKYIFDPRGKSSSTAVLKPIEQIDVDRSKNSDGKVLWTGLVIYLLESKWWKPIPEVLTTGKINSQKVDIIQTSLNGKRVDFFLDQQNHLPIRVNFHNFNKILKTTEINAVSITDYVDIEGIQMPTKEIIIGEGNVSLAYQFNVDFDESIFLIPPSFEEGSQSWKKKN
ncbi:MAG: hypothetical protein ACRD6X_21630 [Pyrinomonadaceae bacterium]